MRLVEADRILIKVFEPCALAITPRVWRFESLFMAVKKRRLMVLQGIAAQNGVMYNFRLRQRQDRFTVTVNSNYTCAQQGVGNR